MHTMSMENKCKLQPLVSIRCLCYNHENYIRDALEGIVNQKTNFPFEAIVHDDASTDTSATIIREYAEKYPNIIKPIYQTENQYSKKDGSIGRIMHKYCIGKYIAICEGDDYWTDPYKLQRQVDYMETNPDCTMTFHPVDIITDNEKDSYVFTNLEGRDYEPEEIFVHWTVPTCSTLSRREMWSLRPYDKRFIATDIVLVLTCAYHGKIHCLPQKMGAYRRLSTGWVKTVGSNQINFIKHYRAIGEHFPALKAVTESYGAGMLAWEIWDNVDHGNLHIGDRVRAGWGYYGWNFVAKLVGCTFRGIRTNIIHRGKLTYLWLTGKSNNGRK